MPDTYDADTWFSFDTGGGQDLIAANVVPFSEEETQVVRFYIGAAKAALSRNPGIQRDTTTPTVRWLSAIRREALRELDRGELDPAVSDVLDRHPDGLKAIAIRRELNRHPAFEFDVPTEYLHSRLSELVKADVIVKAQPGNRYQPAEDADNPAVSGTHR